MFLLKLYLNRIWCINLSEFCEKFFQLELNFTVNGLYTMLKIILFSIKNHKYLSIKK